MTDLSAAAVREARILDVIRRIPEGRVLAYGEVARLAGLPGRARLVARILAQSGHADLPWHRVLRAGGQIAFAPGSRGFREQCRRLRAEGVRVSNGRVKSTEDQAEHSLDRLLWG
ncbi:MGMT family protein [Pseudomarimonas arenosa]|uniref:MGMT family protein n=1 Tax=Pseudomarimonas arenosa TaxID=2774145 RepID=A0AAW3ZQH0_9GAMM|nr:MGMT family protein [Pseudomarimonas arenosa]MBD8527734.1 MGMT family protein [Pseudomarimonas arenosa]